LLLAVKALTGVALVVMALVFGTTPLRLKESPRAKRYFSLTNCLAAGIFVGAGLIHVLNDSVQLLGKTSDFPIAFTLAAGGFFLVLGIDRLVGHGTKTSTFSPFILALVLGIHSLIAGLAVGLEGDLAGATVLLLAIAAHKGSAAFALGVRLVDSGLTASTVRRTVAIFSLTTPAGILLGVYLQKALENNGARLCEGVFDGLAAGTFLYVAIMEILAEEFEKPEDQALKYLCALAGLGLMAVLAIWS
jgi:zinc transporter 1/2/3